MFLKKLLNDLLDNIESLPKSFVDDVFDFSRDSPTVKNRIRTDTLLDELHNSKLDPQDFDEYMQVLLRIMHNDQQKRLTSNLAKTTTAANFTDAFYGDSLLLLEDHLTVHNQLFPLQVPTPLPPIHMPKSIVMSEEASTRYVRSRKFHCKVLPILQSSGFGKTRMCVQLGTIRPGMLVCLRDASARTQQHEQSFLPQDAVVFNYFERMRQILGNITFPATSEQHMRFNKAHLGILAWLSIYCSTLAYYLSIFKQQAGCFGDLGRNAKRNDKANSSPPPLFRTANLRKALLQHICDTADELYNDICEESLNQITEPELLSETIQKHLVNRLQELEQCAPQEHDMRSYSFVAFDESFTLKELNQMLPKLDAF
uniref:Conserved uncharacterized protein (N-terminal) n=1 Tax=Melanopsichium pennsylvanicum 4 TaxID=1398559 RepID=A0A077RCD9_9BASI|nr:conserved uncharacterized protein (N-terminal fragment) [Melanopsichium pennsylvanicum 4]